VTTNPQAVEALAQAALARAQTEVEAALEQALPPPTEEPGRLHEAMRYSTLGGGKRVRPALCLLTAEAAGGAHGRSRAFPAAAALECIHVYSLVHDDLPAMDDDDLRRGRPTSHKVYGEALAILVGDGLQALAFEILAEGYHDQPEVLGDLVRLLARASSSRGMVGGQAIDIASADLPREERALEGLHRRKTGALLRAAVLMGARAGGLPGADPRTDALDRFARAIGLAFQVADDIIDTTQPKEKLGKTPGKDAAQGKLTYVSLLGLEGAQKKARALEAEAHAALEPLGPSARDLRALATFVVSRTS
jgi:geranylgeranyl pyrophosphate synthase